MIKITPSKTLAVQKKLRLLISKLITFLHLSPLTSPPATPCLQWRSGHFSPRAGFTIIELLVVITMVGLVSGVGIFSLVSYGNTQSLEQSVASVKGIFDEAKFNALSSVVLGTDSNGNPVSCTDNLSSYKVNIVPSSVDADSVELYMECGSSTSLIKTYTFPENQNIGVDTTCDEVEYQVISLEASALPLLPCVVSIEAFGQIKTLTIDSIGNLSIQ